MSNLKALCGTTAMIGFLSGSAAWADVTAQQIWGDWKNYFETFGYEVTGSEATAGDTLTVTDISMTMPIPDADGTVAITLGQIGFVDRGDGTVSIEFPPSVPVVIDVLPDGDEPVKVTLDYLNTGFEMIAAGTPEEIAYTYSAEEITTRLAEIVAKGETVSVGTAELGLKDVSGSSVMAIGSGLRELSQVMKTGAVSYEVDFANPEDPSEVFKLEGGLAGMGFEGSGTYPMEGGFDPQNMDAMIKAGFSADGGLSYQGGRSAFAFTDDREQMNMTSSTESGSFAFAMSSAGLRYDVMSRGLVLDVMGGDLPFPVSLAFAEAGLKLLMPVQKSDETQDFAMGLTLGSFTMSDTIWGLFDPAGQLPRDPATIALDLSGKGKLGFDLLDPAQMEALERGEIGMPGEVERLDVNRLEVTAAGASLTGDGGVALDFPTVMMSQGMQGAEGAINLRLSGANGLMDKLVAMGLVPEDQVMGARMMLSMFAVPGDGEDVLTSTIEVKEDGQVLANGQRIK